MATFNQQFQTVGYQYNADTIDFGGVRSKEDVVSVLQQLQQELVKAKAARAAPEQAIIAAEGSLAAAVAEASKPTPEKGKVTSCLESASKVIGGAVALGGLLLAVQRAIEMVGKLL